MDTDAMQEILITGGSGLIGRNLIAKIKQRYNVTVITRDVNRTKRLLGDEIEAITLEQLLDIDKFHAVVNLAGEPIADKRWTDEQKKRICESRWNVTEHLVALINQSPVKPEVFISGSAIGFYGRQGECIISEDHERFYQEFSRELCVRWEEIAAKSNTRTCMLRTGIVLADDGGALQKMLLPFRLGLGGKMGTGTQYMSWIHIADMVRAIEFLLENKTCSGPFNLTAPNPNTNHFFSLRLAERLQRPCLFSIPSWVLSALMGEASDLVLYGQKVVPTRLVNAGFTFRYSKLEDALANLEL